MSANEGHWEVEDGREPIFFYRVKWVDVREKIKESVGGMGFDLVDVERPINGKGLKVFIDKEGGVSIDDCVRVSTQLNRVLEVEQVSFDQLEVSSPGEDRRLSEVGDFQRFLGSKIQLKFRDPIDGLKKFRGIISKVEGNNLVVAVDGTEKQVAIGSIEMARLIPVQGVEI